MSVPSLGCELLPSTSPFLSLSYSGREQKAFLMESFTNLAQCPGLRPSPFLMMIEGVCILAIKHTRLLIL